MGTYKSIIEIPEDIFLNKDLIDLLKLLETVNPCGQSYDVKEDALLISYILKINLFNFLKGPIINVKASIIGLPISLSEKAYYGNVEKIDNMIEEKRGLKIVLNADKDLGFKAQTLSTFVFNNNFPSFKDYLLKLRHPYRRRIKKALDMREKLIIQEIKPNDFTHDHYALYLSVMNRTTNPLETLSIDFFRNFNSKMYEFLDKDSNQVVAFIQLKRIDDLLYFVFCGFNKEDNDKYDLYYNMLLKIVEEGISSGIKSINFGQTSEESKLKIGCVEVPKYLGIHHSNRLANMALQLLIPIFSYKPYKIVHKVFKE